MMTTGRGSGSKIFRASSNPVLFRPVYTNDDFKVDESLEDDTQETTAAAAAVPSPPTLSQSQDDPAGMGKKQISFGTIQIREHALACGNNPSVSYGTPISLDWLSRNQNNQIKTKTKEVSVQGTIHVHAYPAHISIHPTHTRKKMQFNRNKQHKRKGGVWSNFVFRSFFHPFHYWTIKQPFCIPIHFYVLHFNSLTENVPYCVV